VLVPDAEFRCWPNTTPQTAARNLLERIVKRCSIGPNSVRWTLRTELIVNVYVGDFGPGALSKILVRGSCIGWRLDEENTAVDDLVLDPMRVLAASTFDYNSERHVSSVA
jgi:hypothetical protein